MLPQIVLIDFQFQKNVNVSPLHYLTNGNILEIFMKISWVGLNNYMIEKKKIEVFVTSEVKEKIRNKAKDLGVSMGDVIKRALENYLK
jgi:hypothetical protein